MRFVLAVNGWYWGGFATFCRNLALGLRPQGHEVDLLVLPDAELELQVPPACFDKWVVVPRGIGRLASHVAQVAQTIDQLKPDILLLNDTPYGMAALPFISRPIVRIPVLHSVAPEEVELGCSQGQWCDRVVAVSEFVAHAAAVHGLGPRLSICPLGVPVVAAKEVRSRRDGRHPLSLISVGRVVVYQKRMDRVPEIARRLAQRGISYQWVIVGAGDYLPELRRAVKRLGLESRFCFQGPLAPPIVAAAFQAADVFVMPSDCEGMPQALLEAMAQAVVPVVSRIPGSTTCVVEQGNTGYLCQPSEAVEFAQAIAGLAAERALCAELGHRAAGHIAEHFSLEAFAARVLRLVGEVQAQELRRPVPLRPSPEALASPVPGCLGTWRSLRHQTVGRLKRELLKRWAGAATRPL